MTKNIFLDDVDKKCYFYIILSKLQRIIFNLIDNAQGAIKEHATELRHKFGRDAEVKFLGEIVLTAAIEWKDNRHYLIITVTDNAGGFDESILHDIYKKPVRTSKLSDKRQYNEGTSYIGFFVQLMRGNITAENIVFDKDHRGARTTICIPEMVKE